MQTINATFEGGVFKPTQPIALPEHSAVRLTIEQVSHSILTVKELNDFLRGLPKLGDDAEVFAEDIRAIRAEFPAEPNAWE